MKFLMIIALMVGVSAYSAPRCRDKGKFVKCPTSAPAAKSKFSSDAKPRCRDKSGRFAKCM